MKFSIGTSSDSKSVKVDAMVLADTRGLICASSGLGKSWLLRLIAENVASSIQTLLIDPEGEFSSLREKLDVLIVGENGDLRADIRSAGLLARKLAETGVSAVIDIYDLPGPGDPWVKRRLFAALFVSELMNLPKKLYHPMLVMVDEAHQFAQEELTSETYVSEGRKVNPSMMSRSAVRSLMSAGRKRGIGGILATQRISKIDKDAIADARNMFIGGTTLDNDQRRAGDMLGMSKAESVSLRDLDPGTFYSFGPAIDGKGIIQFTSSKVQTTHPKAGQRSSIVVPKASTQISGIVEQFGDLPAIAEEEVKTLDALKKENADLARQLRARPVQAPAETKLERVEVPILPIEEFRSILDTLNDLKDDAEDLKRISGYIESYPLQLQPMMDMLKAAVEKYAIPDYQLQMLSRLGVKPVVGVDHGRSKDVFKKAVVKTEVGKEKSVVEITGPMQRVLDAIAWMENVGVYQPNRSVVAFLANYSMLSSSYTNALGSLRTGDLVTYPNSETVAFTEAGRVAANPTVAPGTTQELHNHIFSRLPGPQEKVLRVLIGHYPHAVAREEIAGRAGYSVNSSSFTNALGALRSMTFIDYPDSTSAIALPILFLE
jgi:hypothetical protein